MKIKGPYLTLVGGVTVAAVLLGLSMTANSLRNDPAPATGNAAVSAPALSAPAPSTPASSTPAPPAPAAPDPEAAGPASYAGPVAGGAASVAVAIRDGRAIAYLCDGRKVEAWLQGTAADGLLNLAGAKGATLTGAYGNGVVSGSVNASGRVWTFRVAKVQPPSGLYRLATTVAGASVVGGWIVGPDGKVVGLLSNGAEAPPIDPATGKVTIDGATRQAVPVDGRTTLDN